MGSKGYTMSSPLSASKKLDYTGMSESKQKHTSADSNIKTDEETITMSEHIEILSKQQDYQFKEGFIFGKKEGVVEGCKSEREKIIEMVDKIGMCCPQCYERIKEELIKQLEKTK